MKKGPESTSQVELMMRMMSSMQKMIERGEGRREEMGEIESVRTGQIFLSCWSGTWSRRLGFG